MAVVSGVLVLLLAKKKNECKSKKGLRSFVTSKTKEAGATKHESISSFEINAGADQCVHVWRLHFKRDGSAVLLTMPPDVGVALLSWWRLGDEEKVLKMTSSLLSCALSLNQNKEGPNRN